MGKCSCRAGLSARGVLGLPDAAYLAAASIGGSNAHTWKFKWPLLTAEDHCDGCSHMISEGCDPNPFLGRLPWRL